MKTIYLIRHSIKEKKQDNNTVDKQKLNEEIKLSEEGKALAYELAHMDYLKNVKEVWASNYERAKETARILFDDKTINVSDSFDERHYGDFDKDTIKDEFWIEQFKSPDLKNNNGESQKDVRKRFDDKINEILEKSPNDEIAIVCHNACILFYLLKYCDLVNAEIPRKLTISYKGKVLIKDSIMKAPSIMKLKFDGKDILDIEYIEMSSK